MRQIQIQLRQIQYPIKTNAISSMYKYNIEIFPDLICAVQLDTSRQVMASVFGKQLVVRLDDTFFQHKIEGIFLDTFCAVH